MPKKKKSALRQTTKDIAQFGMGSVVVGASGIASTAFGHQYGEGVAQVATGMPAMGSVMMAKGQMGMMSEAMQYLPKSRKKKKRR